MQELQKQLDEVDMERAVLEKRKNELEEPEKEAKERHEKWWEGISASDWAFILSQSWQIFWTFCSSM